MHAIAHPVGSWFNTHHGLTNAVILPYVMTFNRHRDRGEGRVIARVLDLPQRGFDGFLAWVLEMRRELGIPAFARRHRRERRQGRRSSAARRRSTPRPAAIPSRSMRRRSSAFFGRRWTGSSRPWTARERCARFSSSTATWPRFARGRSAALGYDSGIGLRAGAAPDRPIAASRHRARRGRAIQSLPAGVGLEDYDGVTMTGSALNIYNGGAPVTRQIELAKAVFAAGVPFFGSCWGLQVAVTAAGGEVRANPRGREFGFARRILLSDAGRRTPLVRRQAARYSRPPACIATRSLRCRRARWFSRTMTSGCRRRRSPADAARFWGVQYHPEYDYLDIAAAAERYGDTLVTEGMFARRAGARRVCRRPACPAGKPRRRARCSGSTVSVPPCATRRCVWSNFATGCTPKCCLARRCRRRCLPSPAQRFGALVL